MSSLVSTGNCKLGHDADGCVHTADATKQFRPVGGVYWALDRPTVHCKVRIYDTSPK